MTHLQYSIHDCILDCQTMVLSRHENQVKLSAKVFDFLLLFFDSSEQIVNKEDAIETIWLGNEGVGKRGVTNAIWSLRKAFSELGIEEEAFHTIPKVGYQLMLTASPISNQASENITNEQLKISRSSSIIYFSITFIVLSLIALTVFYFTSTQETVQISHPVEDHAITTFEGIEEHPAVSHNGELVAFQWLREGQKGQIYVKNLTSTDAPLNLISMGDKEETSPAWSYDDKQLAYVRITEQGQCEIRIRELATNKDSLIDTGCYYQSFRKLITWSNTEDNFIIYGKRTAGATALFRYDFTTEIATQLTFPQVHETDFAPQLTHNNDKLVFIRERGSQSYDVIAQQAGENQTILKGQVSIVDITIHGEEDAVIVNYAKSGQFIIDHIDLSTKAHQHIANRTLPSTISYNNQQKNLAISDHISKEYVALVGFQTSKINRRVSSSSRDMYGRYLPQSKEIMFLSNRSGLWSVWLKGTLNSENLTKDLGNVTVPAVSPDEKQYVVKIASTESSATSLYLGTLATNQLQKLDTNGLQVENLSWAKDGKSIYFFSANGETSGIYNLDLASSTIKQLTQTNEQYAIESDDGNLYMSRLNQAGIWQYNPRTESFVQITDELADFDYGSFFCVDDAMYYLYRNKFTDEVKRISQDGSVVVLASFPKNTIRKYFGISAADSNQFIATLKITNEADINAIPLSLHAHD